MHVSYVSGEQVTLAFCDGSGVESSTDLRARPCGNGWFSAGNPCWVEDGAVGLVCSPWGCGPV